MSEQIHQVMVFKVGWCYIPVCHCGRRTEFTSANRLSAVWDGINHIEGTGSMAEDDMWIIGDEKSVHEVFMGYEKPIMRLIVVSRNEIQVLTKGGIVTETVMELARA